jgi:predicted ABC-type ATPase
VAALNSKPQFHVLAGPNGSGKSTYAAAWKTNFVIHNPDEIAKALGQYQGNILLEAGRILHQRIENDLEARRSFGLETTLSGRNVLKRMKMCANLGYQVFVHFIYVDGLILSRSRVAQRVLMGGHGVAEEDQARRFSRSLDNLKSAVEIADAVVVLNNSSENGHRLVAAYDHGVRYFSEISHDWLP